MIISTAAKALLGTVGLVSAATIAGLVLILNHEVAECKRKSADAILVEDD